jgi:hypothetical protein
VLTLLAEGWNPVAANRGFFYYPQALSRSSFLASRMLTDFEIQRSSRLCAATERKLEPGEVFYSVLESHGADLIRKDFASEAWQGPPEPALAWWKSRVPDPAATRAKLAPNEVLLELFDQLVGQPEHVDTLYVLSLLLIRRRVFREEGVVVGENGAGEVLEVQCAKRGETYRVPAAVPSDERIEQIQQQLSELLFADAK